MKIEKKKIHIGGVHYGEHNIGDEAILYSILKAFLGKYMVSVSSYGSDWIREDFPEVKVNKIFVAYGKPKFGLSAIPRRKVISNTLKKWKEQILLRSVDGYICGGATILSDCPWHSLKVINIVGNAGKRVIVWGVGLAEGSDQETIDYICKILNKPFVDKVYLRDEYVLARLERMGVNKDKMDVSYDPAIMLTGMPFDLNEYISPEEIAILKNGRKNVCISISGEKDVVDRTPIQELIKATNVLINKKKCNVFLIPTGCGAHCQDIHFLKQLYENTRSDNMVFVKKEFKPEHLVEFLKDFEISISSRLHMNIFSACAGILFIGLVRNTKIIDFSQLMGLPYLELENLSANRVIDIFDEVEENCFEYKRHVVNTVKRMREIQRKAIKDITENWMR